MLIYRPNTPGSGICVLPTGISRSPVSLPVRLIRAVGAIGLLVMLISCSLFQRPQPPVAPPAPEPAPVAEPVQPSVDLVAFKAVLVGRKIAPSRHKTAPANPPGGELVAVLNRDTGMLRWKLTFTGSTGQVHNVHFTKSGKGGKATLSVLSITGNLSNPYESCAMLTPEQRNDLLTGRWFVSVSTARFSRNEFHGQLLEQR